MTINTDDLHANGHAGDTSRPFNWPKVMEIFANELAELAQQVKHLSDTARVVKVIGEAEPEQPRAAGPTVP